MRIAVLTSSRSDLGIQSPLLRALAADPFFDLRIIAFGSHVDPRFGHTIDEIVGSGLVPWKVLPQVMEQDDAAGIALAMGRTMEQFSAVWRDHPPDMIVALGDRYEMFSAVAAALPFGVPVAHVHGGETTLGAIDNAMRHSITHMAALHFTCAEPYRQRVVQLIGTVENVHNTGALSMDNLRSMQLLSPEDIGKQFNVDLLQPTVLVTFHPQTAGRHDEDAEWEQLTAALRDLGGRYRLLVTMPNADTGGLRLRERWKTFLSNAPFAQGVDSLGAIGYLSCMKHCAFMLGNSSSGYVEASFFPKHVIDLGERQAGRIVTPNIHRTAIRTDTILRTVERIEQDGSPPRVEVYGDGHAAQRMLSHLRSFAASSPAER